MKMQIKNLIDIKEIVIKKARYQKVMILYDESVTLNQIRDIYELIRNDCIYNQMETSKIDTKEIFNGYKLIIYYMTAESYVKLKFDKTEFINIMIAMGNYVLPFLIQEDMTINKREDFLILNNNFIGDSLTTSLYFNQVYRCFENVVYNLNENVEFFAFQSENIQTDFLQFMSKQNQNMKFLDVEILRETNLETSILPLLDYIILSALETFVVAVRKRTLSMVDVYKVAQNDEVRINKYYEMMNNVALLEIINMKFNYLVDLINQSKKQIYELNYEGFDKHTADFVIENIKEFAQKDNKILGYLYFYNVFES